MLLLVVSVAAPGVALATAASQPSVAVYYGNDVPVDLLDQFDWTVVEADQMQDGQLDALQRYGTTAFAYVSLGEAEHWRGDQDQVPARVLKARNEHWNSQAVDLTQSAWGDYLINRRIRPLWQQGYRGVFLDTLDSYRLFARDDASVAQQQAALVALIHRIHDTFPGIKLLLNRGFEVLDQVHDDIVGVAAESLYKSWDPASGSYRDVSDKDSGYVLNQLTRVRDQYRLPAIAIDYVPPARRDQARATARRIANAGLIPWVTDSALDQVGVGAIEPMPRKVLVLYDKSSVDYGEFANSGVHLFAAMPLEYLGYAAVYQDVNAPLPGGSLKGRYAGIVSWFGSNIGDGGTYREWLSKQIGDGVRVAMFGDPGFDISGDLARRMGVRSVAGVSNKGLSMVDHDDMVGFEGIPQRMPPRETGFKLKSDRSVAHLNMQDGDGTRFAPVVTGDWGGVALSPWVLQQATSEQTRWILNPFTFLSKSLNLPQMPVPDATTENGSRYWMTEIDGDGFVNRAAFPGSPFTAQVMLKQILHRYHVPTTVSVIEGEVGSKGIYPQYTDQVEPIARRIFRLPWVEIGTHTFSHPFDWVRLQEGDLAGKGRTAAGYGFNLPIKGYHFSLEREVAGSTAYINRELAPPGKKVKAVLWSGDALPPEKAIAIADRIGLANINGGNTSVTRDNPTLTQVSPMLRPFGQHVQVYSPEINENVYTNLMTSPLWGFRRVRETYELTNEPRRLKPIDIYFHFYSASGPASLNALKSVFDYALKQQTLPLYASAYSRIARNWYDVGVARKLDGGWQITGATQNRSLRLPSAMGWPDMGSSNGVVGVRDLDQGRYVALSGAPRVTLQLRRSQPERPYLRRANGRVTQWHENGDGVTFRLASQAVPLEMDLGGTAGCSIDTRNARRSGDGDHVSLRYGASQSGRVRIACGR